MNESLYPDSGSLTLEDVIVDPTLWASRLNEVREAGFDSLYTLRLRLQGIEGPIARAREAQVLLHFGFTDQAIVILENEDHPLCKAMFMAALLQSSTLSNYLYITEQSPVLTEGRTRIEREAQMRWDFIRAQTFQHIKNFEEALCLYRLAHGTALVFEVESIVRVCEVQIQVLTADSPEAKISILKVQLEEARRNKDIQTANLILGSLCNLYSERDDYVSFLECAEEISHGASKEHMVLFAKFLLGESNSALLPSMEGPPDYPFCAAARLLWASRELLSHARYLKSKKVMNYYLDEISVWPIARSKSFPIGNIVSLALKAITQIEFGNLKVAEKFFNELNESLESTKNFPKSAEAYVYLIETLIFHKETGKIAVNLLEKLKFYLSNSASFANFVLEFCPEVVVRVNSLMPNNKTEKLMGKILIIKENGGYLGKTLIKGFSTIKILREAIESWKIGESLAVNQERAIERYRGYLDSIDCRGVVLEWEII
ncbi:MAG: hypothetical protein U0Z75_08060 [Deinococcaceae bacterium]